MAVEADAVPHPVDEVLAVSGVVDDRPRCSIDVLGRDAGTRRLDPGLLRSLHDRVDAAVLVVRLANVERPRRVRAVPADLAAEVDHDRIALSDHAPARLVMRRRRVRPRGDDLERGDVAPFFDGHRRDLI